MDDMNDKKTITFTGNHFDYGTGIFDYQEILSLLTRAAQLSDPMGLACIGLRIRLNRTEDGTECLVLEPRV